MNNNRVPVLEVNDLGIDFGGLTAVNELSMTVGSEEIVGLIGPNGAGKTTVFNMLTKVYKPTRGTIRFLGQDTSKMTVVEMNRAGAHGIPVPDYVDENVSAKVVKIIQSYTGVVDKMVWRKY